MNCWHCGNSIDLRLHGGLGKKDECPKCEADLHVCRNCRFFDLSAENECAEPMAEWMRFKDKANYCDYFEVVEAADRGRQSATAFTDDARKAWDQLFKA